MKKKSFFERLTGGTNINDDQFHMPEAKDLENQKNSDWMEEELEEDEGQLTVDAYQTSEHIIIKSVVAGIKSDELDIDITPEMVTIKGKRQKTHTVSDEDSFFQELYWGSFSRSVLLPQEVDVDKSKAKLKDGILTIKLPKIDRSKSHKLKVDND